ncbi:PKD-like family lipoprotein [Gabonibacter chumensis]|uniref:PKD-like family lipoprotein n=1 Tax=Gabonibacter chumensis TaxID=2972474 RepID=UPI0025746DC9|nr:PKD-like family lipoprotein [Gabonibacter chumensis]MCR9013145.1 PKD-like family lipoprotein [Gabonibacter chumensis]
MKTIYFILLLCMTWGITGCYDDKGNYDYKTLNNITIDFPKDLDTYPVVGDVLKIHPTFTYASGDSTGLSLSYEWSYDGKVIGTDRDLEWTVNTTTLTELVLRVKEENSGIIYIKDESLHPSGRYDRYDSYMALTEKNGKANIVYLRRGYVLDENGEEIYSPEASTYLPDFTIIEDVYTKENGGVELGGKPLFWAEHRIDEFNTVAHATIFQEGGIGCVDLDGRTMIKDIFLNEAFIGKTYPVNFHPVNAINMRWIHLIENKDGKIYTRIKDSESLFHSGYYISTPLMFDKKEINGSLVGQQMIEPKYCLVHDKTYNRLLLVTGLKRNFLEDINIVGRVMEMPTPEKGWPDDFVPLDNMGDNELIYIGGFSYDNADYRIQYDMIIKRPDGKYYYQYFQFKQAYDKDNFSYNKVSDKEVLYNYELSNQSIPYGNSTIYTLPTSTNPYLFIANGSQLYMIDRKNPALTDGQGNPRENVKLYYTCPANIVTLDGQIWDGKELMVGMEGGKFMLLSTHNARNTTFKVLWPQNMSVLNTMNIGNIVDLHMKKGRYLP